MGGFLYGIPQKLIKRVNEIEIDTHYYDSDVIPSAQEIFIFNINEQTQIAECEGFKSNNIAQAVMPYKAQYGEKTSHMFAMVTSIKDGSFKDNSYLTDMTLPNTISIIPTDCFKNCNNLNRVNISKSIRIIKSGAFEGCSNLQSLFIPFNVSTIEPDAFKNCDNLKIICYKHSVAEEYAQANNIPYSLISYTLDDDITQNSENLVTSGTVWKNIKSTLDKITAHINNKSNPHDDSTFNNTKLTGTTNVDSGKLTTVTTDNTSLVNRKFVLDEVNKAIDPQEGSGYQKVVDYSLDTNSKTISGAINEIYNKVNTLTGVINVVNDWYTISLNRNYPTSWSFLNKPYCYTDNGISVDYRIKNRTNNSFDIMVPCECNYSLSVTDSGEIAGYPIDYIVLSYYYTGIDGRDLDTVTGINNTNWPSYIRNTVGYAHSTNISYDNKTLVEFGGDNRGGDSSETDLYYESVYFDVKRIQDILPNEDIEIILYATWYGNKARGDIHISLDCYESSTVPTINKNNNIISLSNLNPSSGVTNPIYSNNNMIANITTKKGAPNSYKAAYTPAFKIILKKSNEFSNYRTINIQTLS